MAVCKSEFEMCAKVSCLPSQVLGTVGGVLPSRFLAPFIKTCTAYLYTACWCVQVYIYIHVCTVKNPQKKYISGSG